MLIACNGLASFEQLVELKKAGIFSYNHNLETSREFFPQICTTHSWESRFETNLNAKRAGIEKFPRKSIERIVEEAHIAKNNHALGFCLVTAGLGLDDDKLAYVCEAARAVKRHSLI